MKMPNPFPGAIFIRGIGRAFSAHPLISIGGTLVGFWAFVAIAAPVLALYDPDALALNAYLEAPSWTHFLGTDEVGRDLLSRVIFGARTSLFMAFGIVGIGLVVGSLIGAAVGIAGGVVDMLAMRFVDLMLAMPSLVIALALTAALGPGIGNAMISLGVMSVPSYMRIARSQTLLVRELAYVRWSEQAGGSFMFRLRNHVLPNIVSPLIVVATLHCGAALLAGGALSFIGLGAQPPLAEWGALVNTGRRYLLTQAWYPLFPGFAILTVSLGFNMLGDGLRDLLDPKSDGTR